MTLNKQVFLAAVSFGCRIATAQVGPSQSVTGTGVDFASVAGSTSFASSSAERRSQAPTTAAAKPAPPVGTLSAGWAYLFADQGMGAHSNLNGWLVKPTYNLANGWAVYLDASNYYGRNAKGSINLHTYSVGVSKEVLARQRLRPALFLQMGDSRNSNAGAIVNSYALLTGINFTTPLRPWVSLSIIPAEYVFTYPDGDPRHSYNAKVALVFPFGHKSKK